MASFKLVEANGKTVCRGRENACIAVAKSQYRSYHKLIPKGSKSLEISVYGAGGGATAYYCEVCLLAEFEKMEKLMEEAKRMPTPVPDGDSDF
jgi:hypothetical protein